MKRYFSIYRVLILISATVLVSCEKQLEETVYSSVMTTNFYQSPQDAEAALTAAYGPLGDLYVLSTNLCSADFQDDQTWAKPVVGRNVFPLFTYDPDYSALKSFGRELEGPYGLWRYCYKGIENANWVIEKVPAIDMPAARRDAIVGEALFLRAFFHFTLARNFGDVIIRTTTSKQESDTYLPKSPKKDVYLQIFKDLDEAQLKLPAYSNAIVKGRPSKEVAIALHAKSALYAEDWTLAKEKAALVINSGKYSMLANAVDVFDVEKEDQARQEVLFAFEGDNGNISRTSNMMGLCGPPNSAGKFYGNSTFGSIFAYQSFYNSFNPIDERRLLLDTFFINTANNRVSQKDIMPFTPNAVLIKKYI